MVVQAKSPSTKGKENGSASSLAQVFTGAPKSADDFIQVPFKQLVINYDTNVRKTYPPERVARLVDQIKEDGMRRPIDITDRLPDGRYEVVHGFTRCKALEIIYGKAVGDYIVTCRVNKGKNGRPLSSDEKMVINLGSDESQEPVKQSEVAERVHYMIVECGIRQEHVAKRCFVDSGKVSQLKKIWEKLHPEIKEAWKKAPSRDAEIPLSQLSNWIQYPPDQQLIAFRQYVAPPDELSASAEDGLPGTTPPAVEKPAILWKLRGKKEIVEMYERLKLLQKESPREFKSEHEGAMKVLRWALSAEGTKNREGLQKAPF